MDGITHNITRGLVRAILEITNDDRHSSSIQSECHNIYCIFPTNDDDHSPPCRVISDNTTSSDENRTEHINSVIIAKYIHLYIYPLFILMGIFGNSLSCFIMFINVRRSGYPASFYLTLLAFVDCLFLLGSALPDWISQIHHKLDIKLLSDFFCRFVYWFGHFTTHLSAGLVVGVTVERFIAVQYPLIAHKINTVKHTRIALIIVIIFFFLLDSPVFILVKHSNESVHIVKTCLNETDNKYVRHDMLRCGTTNERYKQAWVYVDMAVYTLIPFLIIVTLNCLIIRRLIDAQRFRQRMFIFNNATPRYDHQEMKYRNYSDSHVAIEMIDKHRRHSKRFQSVPETRPLAIMLRPQLSQVEERRRRYSTKQSSISTELSTLSFEMKTRSHYQYEISSIRCKTINTSTSNNTRLTILLLFVSCSFLVLTLPYVAFNLLMSTKSKTRTSISNYNHLSGTTTDNIHSNSVLSYTITRLFMIINHSINFILYFVLGKRFRRDLRQLFIGYWRKLYRRQE